jgi:hypothetical protein
MRAFRTTPFMITCQVAVLALAVSGCGSSSKTATSPATTAAPATPVVTTPAAPPAHVSITSPRARSHTAQTFTVRLVLRGGGTVAKQFSYLLDGHRVRVGSTRTTFHHVTPGHHRLEVILIATPSVHATTTFTVRAPKVVVSIAPVLTTPATTPTVSTPAPTPTIQQTTPKPKPKPTPAPTPKPSGGGIPQGGAGDGDSDNSGGASDGDGNL